MHALLELDLVITLGSLGLNILLNGINLALILNELLLDIIEPIVYLTLQYLILLRVMLHRVECHLLCKPIAIALQKVLNRTESILLLIKLPLQIIGFRELILHVILH